jgi:CBS domain containing-hemolysin-like protein
MESDQLGIILISLLLSAFFSGVEIAFVSANKLKVELDKKAGNIAARVYSVFMQKPATFITTMLLGNNIALVVYGIKMGDLLDPVFLSLLPNPALVLLVKTIVSTLIILVTAEFLPKAIFQINPNRTLNVFIIPVVLVYYGLYPLVWFVTKLSDGILELIGIPKEEQQPLFGIVDLDHFVREATSGASNEDEIENEVQIFRNALDFSAVKARDCMIPRTEIVAFDLEDPVDELWRTFIDTGLSKIVIYRDNIDNVIGYVHSAELFKQPEAIKNILLPISIVPESMSGSEVLELLISQKRSMAVVVDEFGGTSGLVTMEDVVEEIFGEIEDEHDVETLIEVVLDENTFKFSARLEIDYLNETYKLNLPESEEYETLAGLIISHHESIPEEDELIRIENYSFKILGVSDRRIDLVQLHYSPAD